MLSAGQANDGGLIMQGSLPRNKLTFFRIYLSHKLSRQMCINWGSNPEDLIMPILSAVSQVSVRFCSEKIKKRFSGIDSGIDIANLSGLIAH